MFEEHKPAIALVLGSIAYNTANELCQNLPSYVKSYSNNLGYPIYDSQGLPIEVYSDLPDELQGLLRER